MILKGFLRFQMIRGTIAKVSLPAVLGLAVFFVTPAADLAQTVSGGLQSVDLDERYRIGFQDVLEVQVFRHPELTQRVTVNPNGVIFLPRLERPIVAACKTERELAGEIAKEYETFLKNPFVNVVVADQRSQSFGVIGAVTKPGSFYISRRIQLLELISLAGGPTKEAGSRLIVARTGSTTACKKPDEGQDTLAFLTFQIKDIQEGKQVVWMKPGDIVSVLDSDRIYIYGAVAKPGELKVKEPITLRQAIASAEGFAGNASKSSIRVLRQAGNDGEWRETSYSLSEIDRGRIKDPVLMPNDIVAVSGAPLKSILRDITRAVTGGLGNLPIVLR